MNGIQLGNCGDTFADARDYFERSGSAFWLQEWQQTFDPDVHQQYSLPIDVPEPRTIMLIYAREQEPGVRDQESGVRSQEPGDRHQGAGIRDQGSGVSDPCLLSPASCLPPPASCPLQFEVGFSGPANTQSFRERQATYSLEIWKRGDFAPRIGPTETFHSKPETYGAVQFNRRIQAKQRLWYDTNVTKDIVMQPGEGHVLCIQPHTLLDLVIQIGGFV